MTLFESTSRSRYQQLLDEWAVFWVTDPGHGWLAVPLDLFRAAGIADKVSSYSYIGSGLHGYDGYVLLEEDCDAGLYIDAVTTRERAFLASGEFTFDQPGCSGNVAHNVRALDSYDASRVK